MTSAPASAAACDHVRRPARRGRGDLELRLDPGRLEVPGLPCDLGLDLVLVGVDGVSGRAADRQLVDVDGDHTASSSLGEPANVVERTVAVLRPVGSPHDDIEHHIPPWESGSGDSRPSSLPVNGCSLASSVRVSRTWFALLPDVRAAGGNEDGCVPLHGRRTWRS